MAPQARIRLPPELQVLTKGEMAKVIEQANVGAENEKIARLYFMDRMPQVDVAAELFLGRATVQRRLPEILKKIEKSSKRLYS
jgi:DNA-directed RNA polymerase specialized sigma subunit|nr:MAG TPA_asm: FocB protein-alpha, helix-turn-helix, TRANSCRIPTION.4A [Caudoviricetes sp.]